MRALFTRTIKKKKKKEKHAFTRFKDRPLSVVRLLRYSYVSSQYARPYPKYKRGARNLSLSPFPPSPIGVATVILPPSWFKINKRSRANGPKIPASGTAAGDVYPGRKWILEPDFRDRVRTTISPRKEPPSRGRERERERGVDVIDSLSSTISFLDTIQTGRSLWKPDTWGWSALPSNRTSITACRSCRLFVVFDGRWSFLIIRFFLSLSFWCTQLMFSMWLLLIFGVSVIFISNIW